jgi:phage-related protein
MPGTQAVYYRTSKGTEPVNDFIDSLPIKKQARLDIQIDRLNNLRLDAPPLKHPATSQVRGELRELRCHYGPELYRVLYRRSGNLFVLLHILRKNTGKIPPADIKAAEDRWDDFKARMDAQPRHPPRAIGRDAP